jgi:hypothetical protein
LSKIGQKIVKKLSKSCQKVVKKLSKGCQKSWQKVGKKLSKSCQKVATNFVSPGKKPKKVNRLENKNGNKKKKIIGIP